MLGTIHDVTKIADMVHTIPGAKLCVDGVALAPHREVDVKALGVDFYAFSWYKVRIRPGPAVEISLRGIDADFTPRSMVPTSPSSMRPATLSAT